MYLISSLFFAIHILLLSTKSLPLWKINNWHNSVTVTTNSISYQYQSYQSYRKRQVRSTRTVKSTLGVTRSVSPRLEDTCQQLAFVPWRSEVLGWRDTKLRFSLSTAHHPCPTGLWITSKNQRRPMVKLVELTLHRNSSLVFTRCSLFPTLFLV